MATVQLPNIPPDPRQQAYGFDEVARKLHERGVVVLAGRLDPVLAERTIVQLLAMDLDRGADGDTVTLQVNGVTGDVGAALAIHDVLRTMATPTAVIAGGLLDAAGAVIVAGGSVGKRRLLPSARVHLRRPEEPSTQGLSLESAAQEVTMLRDRVEDVLGVALHPSRMLSGAEAVALGMADTLE